MTALRAPWASASRWFWLVAGVIVLGNVAVLSTRPDWLGTPVPEWPLAIDLLVLLPLSYLWVNRHKGRRAWLGAAVLAGFGVLVGSFLLPNESKHLWLVLEPLRYAVLGVIVLAQSAILVPAVIQVRRAARTVNAERAIDETLRARFGEGLVTNLLRLESRVWLYALIRNPSHRAFPGENFSSHRQGFNASSQQGFVMLAAAEIPVAHLLLHLFAGPLVAAVVTGLSIYGFVFLLAEYRATLHRPISVGDHGLHLRYGVLVDAVLPWQAIATVERCAEAGRRASGKLRLRGMGVANVRIQLQPGTRVVAVIGARAISEIRLGLDDPAGFIEAVERRIAHFTKESDR